MFYWVFIEFSGVLLGFYRVCWPFTMVFPMFNAVLFTFSTFFGPVFFEDLIVLGLITFFFSTERYKTLLS